MELHVPLTLDAIADRRPNDSALLQGNRSLSWQDLRDRTNRFACVLRDYGIGRVQQPTFEPWESPHDHVALYLLNCPEYLEGMVGAWKAGAASVNVNYRYVAKELAYLLTDSSAAAIVVHARFAPVLAEVLPGLAAPPRLILQVADETDTPLLPGAVDYETALAGVSGELPASLRDSWSGADRYICYTGGTTGSPKGTLWRQDQFLRAALGIHRSDGSSYESIDELLAAQKPHLRALPAPPLMHGAAHWNAISCWMAGGTVVLQEEVVRFDPSSVLEAVGRHNATSLLLVGDPMARPLVAALQQSQHDLSSLRHVVSGGAVLSPTVRAQLLRELPGVAILDVLGSTESGRQGVSSVTASASTQAGFVPSRNSVVLSADLSRRLSPGSEEIGWLSQTGDVPLGYLGHQQQTAATFPVIDGIRHAIAGDRARLLATGLVELLGRDSVCINTGGEKVFAEEVEVAITSHPEIVDAVVCGRPSERYGQEIVAVIQVVDGSTITDDQLREHAGLSLAGFKIPRELRRVSAVVRSPSGKADYRWAQAQVAHSGGGIYESN